MKRPILKGPKLIAVGPLKCFKGNSSSSGGSTGGGGGTVRDPVYGTAVKVSDVGTARRTGAVVGRDSAGARSRQGRIGAAYDAGTLNQAGGQRDFVQEAARIKQKEDNIKKMMLEDPTAFRGLLDSTDPETAAMAEAAAMGEQNKKEAQIKKDIVSEKKLKNLLKTAIPNIALDVVGLGAVNLATALASEVLSPEKKAQIVKSLEDNVPGVKAVKEAFEQESEAVSDAEVQAALDSGEYDNPDNPNVYDGSPRTQTAKTESKGGDKFTPPPIANVKVAQTVVDEKVEEGPKTPAAMSEADLTAMLEKRARGEDSVVEREAKMARDRGLSQQLAAVRGARGATAGQRLRALRRGSETMEREIQPQVAAAKAKEQQAAQDALLQLKTGDRRRAEEFAQQEKLAKLKQPKGGGGGARPKDQGFLGKLKTGLGLFKQGKKLFGFEEGGFVSGPGTETSDSIPARLSDGEFVVKASAVRGLGKAMGAEGEGEERKKGVDFLYKLQDRMDKVEKFGGGGPVEKEEPEVEKGKFVPSKKYGKLDEDKKRKLLRERQKMMQMAKKMGIKVEMKKYKEGGEIEPDYDRFLKFMDKGVSHSLMKKRIQKARIPKQEKEKLLKGLGEEPKFAEGGEAYSRPKKAFREAIGYEAESRFHDKALKDTKHGGARRKFRHFQDGGLVDIKKPDMVKEEFKMPTSGYGSVVAAQGDLMRRIEELERKMGK